jgi:hypothetical protein
VRMWTNGDVLYKTVMNIQLKCADFFFMNVAITRFSRIALLNGVKN